MAKRSSQFPPLPPAFLQRMEALLGEEFPAFLTSLLASPSVGLRVNTLKLSAGQFEVISPFRLVPVAWCLEGFTLGQTQAEGPSPGKHPFHAAGLYYLQEPSAMAAAELLAPQPGELVLDLAAAPGGKATHLAARMQGRGLLIANEVHPKRVWDLAENMERWGARNVAITNETPERLAGLLGPIFDRVLVDAPCSGESLFRRNPAYRSEWNPNLIQGCSNRQKNILKAAAGLVKPGGRLAYTTCTFNPEENEGSLAAFLDEYPDFEVVKTTRSPHFSPGRPDWLGYSAPVGLSDSIRLWPHLISGEGHFIAILQRNGAPLPSPVVLSNLTKPPMRVAKAFEEFCQRCGLTLPFGLRLNMHGTYLYHTPAACPDLGRLRLAHPGWWLGAWKKDRFEPSHALAMGIGQKDIHCRIDLSLENPDLVHAYLKGESLLLENLESRPIECGWAVVTVAGFPLGWVKVVQGAAKNYYPRGLRWS